MVSNYEEFRSAVSLGADSNEVVTRHRTMGGLVVKIRSGETVVKPMTEDLVTVGRGLCVRTGVSGISSWCGIGGGNLLPIAHLQALVIRLVLHDSHL